MAILRGKYLNIRDTWDIACVAAILGSLYGGLSVIVFSGGHGSLGITVVSGGLTVVSLPVMLVFCATAGWWMMRFIGSRVRVNRLLVFAMAGMAAGFLVDAVGVGIFILNHGVAWLLHPRRPEILGIAWLLSLAPCYLMLAAVLGGMRWKQLEDREIV
ncbi:hypothetical protein OVA24_16905 [Luteolibacter sp. SL250]|uniref:hypothetical protein n=1 Tax=Luteolibacter sp. SL250 TaxID=2995170 RepID=UPI00226E51F7|nr:hypothetical protein [Luteolibacter sp. SL250]WAC18913.1 hypothetical protein OVA24_16905 [Luteolibacter sp. SL250]